MGVIPPVIGLFILNGKYELLESEYAKNSEKTNIYSERKFYAIGKDLKKGDIISEADLVEVNLYAEESVKTIKKESVIGKELKVNVSKGVLVNMDMLVNEDRIPDDLRLHMLSNVELHSEILDGSVIDIRISFPNGEDYVLISGKKVKARIDDKIFIYVNEEEILKLSSANIDKSVYAGAKIYAILYVKDYQKNAISNYPASFSVIELGNWDPNLIDKVFTEDMVSKRMVLEEHISQFSKGRVEK
ncbi:MAG: hypothetical protein IJA34_14930 [Lachnospiraceae bacterium]|nr:hypothetical protein [Lachnospiraceae bacterium]